MKFAIKHEIKGRIRIHLAQKHMTYRQADILQCYRCCLYRQQRRADSFTEQIFL